MRIAIDIDDTLTCTSESFDRVIKKYNEDFPKKFKDRWTEEEANFIFKNYLSETLKNSRLKKYSKEVLKKLNLLGHELFIITARNENHCQGVEKMTKDLFEKNDIKISGYYFGQFLKSDVAKKLNINLMIDDNKEVFNNMKKENIDCILFEDKIKNWNEVFEYIKQKEE